MAGVDWKSIRKTIENEAIKTLGENTTVTINQPSDGLFSASDPEDGVVDSPTAYTVNAVVVPITKEPRRPDATVTLGDLKIIVSGLLDVEPTVGWTVEVQGTTYRIIQVDIARPGTTVIAYTIYARR